MIPAALVIVGALLGLWLGFRWGYVAGVTDTERRWSDATARRDEAEAWFRRNVKASLRSPIRSTILHTHSNTSDKNSRN